MRSLPSFLPIVAAFVFTHAGVARTEATYPNRSIQLVVTVPPGGAADIVARIIGQKLSDALGQPVVINNRAGAGGTTAAAQVAKAAPDGYTLLATASTLTINPSLYANLTYNPIKDFAPITPIATTPLVLVVHPSLSVRSVRELIALAKAKPTQILYGSPGNGSTPHLAAEMFNTMAGVKLMHVPYKGVTGAFSDLLGGQISLMFPGAPIALPQVKAGKLRALGTTGAKRTPAAPELPTIAEAGLPGYEVSVWYGILAPAGTPAAVINRLNTEIVRIVQLRDINERWAALGAEPSHSAPEQFAAFLKKDLGKWAKVVRDSGAKID